MAERIDIERMIMQANYELSLTTSLVANTSVGMDYEKRIRELLQATSTLLDSNKILGEKIQILTDENLALHTKLEKLEGQLEQFKRGKYGNSNEKNPGKPKPKKGSTKDEEENIFIENEGVSSESEEESEEDKESASSEPKEPKERDTSNRPSRYNTMHADLCVVHDCDIEKLKEMGLEFIRYSRPVDQFDRISVTRQDRYLYAWVRDKKGNEFPIFVAKADDNSSRFLLSNESSYDMPKCVPHTSCTSNMLSDLCVNRFQYAISTGREMYRMFNEKMQMSRQTILNWLKAGSRFLECSLESFKKMLLKKNTILYCDESWVNTKVV